MTFRLGHEDIVTVREGTVEKGITEVALFDVQVKHSSNMQYNAEGDKMYNRGIYFVIVNTMYLGVTMSDEAGFEAINNGGAI